MTENPPSVPTRLADVQRRIAAAARAGKRDPASVHLVAVTKTYILGRSANISAAPKDGKVDLKWLQARSSYGPSGPP